MPLSDEATLFVPYVVHLIPNSDPLQWVAVQVDDTGDLLYASPITWPTREEAERHAHDLNYLREESVKKLPTTTLWIAVDVYAAGAEALDVVERVAKDDHIIGWRLLNPAADDDNAAWESARKEVQNALETLWQDELPEDRESLFDHLKNRHDFDFESVPEQPEA